MAAPVAVQDWYSGKIPEAQAPSIGAPIGQGMLAAQQGQATPYNSQAIGNAGIASSSVQKPSQTPGTTVNGTTGEGSNTAPGTHQPTISGLTGSVGGVNGSNTDPAYYKAQTISDPTQWNVDDNQTAQGQLGKILNSGSSLMQQAATSGLQTAASRGLLNSSMAVGASENAMIANAAPIATHDANTYSQAAGYNAKQSNDIALANQDALNRANSQRATDTNAAYTNSANHTFTADQNKVNHDFDAEQNKVNHTFTAEQNKENQDFTAKQNIIKANVEASIAKINNSSNFTLQSQQIFGTLSTALQNEISTINQSTTMNQASKDYAIKQLYDNYKAEISMLSAVGSVSDISKLLVE